MSSPFTTCDTQYCYKTAQHLTGGHFNTDLVALCCEHTGCEDHNFDTVSTNQEA